MRIAITGCDGFIGTYLTKELESNSFEVLKIDFKYGHNITQSSTLKSIPPFDVMVHLAARSYVPESYSSPGDFYNVNVMGTINTLELCRKYNAKMIFTSSYIYGTPQYLPIDEIHPVVAFNPYAQTKIIGEEICQGYNRDFKTKVIIIRPFNIFGSGQNENFLIPSIIKQAKTGNIKLGDSTPKRDFIYIKDLIRGFRKAIEFDSESLEAFNFGSGISYSVKEIVNQISSLLSKSIEVQFTEEKRINEIKDTVANIEKAQKLLSWKPSFTFSEGIIDYFKMTVIK